MVAQATREVDARLMEVLREKQALGRHCDALRRYVLLGQVGGGPWGRGASLVGGMRMGPAAPHLQSVEPPATTSCQPRQLLNGQPWPTASKFVPALLLAIDPQGDFAVALLDAMGPELSKPAHEVRSPPVSCDATNCLLNCRTVLFTDAQRSPCVCVCMPCCVALHSLGMHAVLFAFPAPPGETTDEVCQLTAAPELQPANDPGNRHPWRPVQPATHDLLPANHPWVAPAHAHHSVTHHLGKHPPTDYLPPRAPTSHQPLSTPSPVQATTN